MREFRWLERIWGPHWQKYLPVDSEQDKGPLLYLQSHIFLIPSVLFNHTLLHLKGIYFSHNISILLFAPAIPVCIIDFSSQHVVLQYSSTENYCEEGVFWDSVRIPLTNSLFTYLLHISFPFSYLKHIHHRMGQWWEGCALHLIQGGLALQFHSSHIRFKSPPRQ